MKTIKFFWLIYFGIFFLFFTLSRGDNLPYVKFSKDAAIIWYSGYDPSQEIQSARTLNTKVFRTENGNIVYRIFAHPVHYVDEVGKLEDIIDTCCCSFDWQINESYSGYADGLFEEKNVCGINTTYILVNEGYYYRGFVEFNTDAIPDTATIDSVLLNLYCIQWLNPIEGHDIWSMENKPSSSGAMTVYNDAADGNCYVSNYMGNAGWNSWNLGTQACQDMFNLLPEDWFAIGISGFYSSSSADLTYQCGTGWIDVIEPTGVKEDKDIRHKTRDIRLLCYPNPFTTITHIIITLPSREQRAQSIGQSSENVLMNIYNVSGRLVRSLPLTTNHSALTTAVSTIVSWDGTDGKGKKVSPGVYFAKLSSGDFKSVKKIVLVK